MTAEIFKFSKPEKHIDQSDEDIIEWLEDRIADVKEGKVASAMCLFEMNDDEGGQFYTFRRGKDRIKLIGALEFCKTELWRD